jgi:nucleoside-diphosphate-sugar epimerase
VAQTLADAEAAFIAACEHNGVAWTLLRPTLIYLEGRDRNVSRLAGLIRRLGVLPLAGRGYGLRQPVHAEDLALGALAALAQPATHGRAYDLPGGETLSYREMVLRIFQALGRRPRVLALPPALWAFGFALARLFLPGTTAAMGARMEADLTFDGSAAQTDFSWRPRRFCPHFPDAA